MVFLINTEVLSMYIPDPYMAWLLVNFECTINIDESADSSISLFSRIRLLLFKKFDVYERSSKQP